MEDLDGEPLLLEDQPTTDNDLSGARRKSKQKRLGPPAAPEDVMTAFSSHRRLFRKGSSGRPYLYEEHDSFWISEPSVSAAIGRDTSPNTPLTSTPLFFHWDPISLAPEGIRCPATGCSNLLRYRRTPDRPRGALTNALERRIAFWICAPQYQCVGCPASQTHPKGVTYYLAWDLRIIERLPHALRLQFPVKPTASRTSFIATEAVVEEVGAKDPFQLTPTYLGLAYSQISKQILGASGSPFSMRGVSLPPSLVFAPSTESFPEATPPQPTRASASNTDLQEVVGWTNGSITPSSAIHHSPACEVAWRGPSSPPHSSPVSSSSPQLQHVFDTQTMSYRDLAASFQVSGGLCPGPCS